MRILNFSYFIFLILICSACAERKAAEIKGEKVEINTKNDNVQTDELAHSLKYTSGVGAILQDSKGNYWFGSNHEGLCLFDGTTFTYFTVEDGLSDNQIRRIQEDHNGVIWLGTGNGVSSYQKGLITNHTAINPHYGLDLYTEGKWALEENDLWFNAGNKSGAFRFDGQELHYLAFPLNDENSYNPTLVTDFAKGKNQLWIASYAAVFGYDGQSFEVIDDARLGFTQQPDLLHVRSVLEDSKGNLWIGNNGIGVLLKSGDSIVNFSIQQGLVQSDSFRMGGASPAGTLEHVFAIEEDQHGNIWFGDRDTGAWKYDGHTMTNFTQKDGLTNAFVHVIYKDNNGSLWLGLGDGNLFLFNGKSFERKFG